MRPKAKGWTWGVGVAAIAALLILNSFVSTPTYSPNTSFTTGEGVKYRIHYGFINAATAQVEVSPAIVQVNSRPCYKIDVKGQTVGAFELVARIRDNWRSYVDTSYMLPHKFYQNIQENKYRKEETVVFDRDRELATSEVKSERKTHKIPRQVHDVVSGYYYLRTINFDKVRAGEVVEVPTFFDGEVFKMKVRYRGREVVKTQFGKIKVFKLNPVMPPNKLFKGENSIRIWVSDDLNKIPVKVEVDLWVGSMDIDLQEFRGLKNELQFF